MSELFHVRHGHGHPIVVLHGGLGLDHTYMRALDRLGDVAELIYVDLRGNGRSSHPPRWEDQTLATMADDIDALRAQLGFERWTVMGHSFGALVSIVYASRHPERTATLVPICGAPSFQHAPSVVENIGKRGQPEAAAALLAVLGQPAHDDAHFADVWTAVLPLYFHRWEPRYQAAFATTRWSAAGYNRGNELLGTFDGRPDLARITAPTLVVSTDDDFIMPVELCGAAIAGGIANARHEIVSHAGHFPFLEQPAAFDRIVRDWVAAAA